MVIDDLLADTPLAALLPPREVATAVVALVLGLETLGRLDVTAPRTLLAAVDRVAAATNG